MNNKLTLSSLPAEEASTPSDDAIRQALLRMGSGFKQQRQHRPESSAAAPTGEIRRRRFSQNEHVPVEYVGRERDRASPRAESAPEPLFNVPSPPDGDAVSRLERALDRERQMREAAEQAAAELKSQLNGLRTRIAHLDIELGELRATRAAEAAATAVALSNAASGVAATPPDRDAVPSSRPRGRPRSRPLVEEEEQEPVKWWTD
ncbi:MAG: hypothetical protein INR65_12440 [Gluconacetobacter diazotrophicus]|nr:hypothetical protein [Gluconacetobacter diazotrophicus]